jgi:Nuclear cap-binding protein subunit 3
LTTADILSHFNTYGPSYVEWLNDSSCNVVFPDKFTVKRAIVQMGEALTDAEKEQNRSGAMHFVRCHCERITL